MYKCVRKCMECYCWGKLTLHTRGCKVLYIREDMQPQLWVWRLHDIKFGDFCKFANSPNFIGHQ